MLKYLFSLTYSLALAYLITAFALWEVNAELWGIYGRISLIVAACVFFIFRSKRVTVWI